jgi:thiol-disulfide isomerase/thioredoxin
MRTLLCLPLLLCFAACASADPDLDSDGDGLTDAIEAELGTDPALSDSDGDGYEDGDEQQAGSDPTDPDDVIYTGGWPYNSSKDDLADPGWDPSAEEGSVVPRYTAVDQYGDQVELWDFGGHDRPVVLDMGTIWCAPCKGLAAYLSTGDVAHVADYPWWDPAYEGLYDMVQNEEIYWVTVLFSESESHGPSTQEDCEAWHAEFPNDKIPVLADSDLKLHDWLGITAYPVLNLIDSGLNLTIYRSSGPYGVLTEVPNLP